MRRLLFFVAATSLLYGSCLAQPVQARHARIELVSAQRNVAPGQELLLGLHFFLEKNWHIYWTNPGDSGQPAVLQWQLPPGATAGALQWPVPEKLKHSTLADYGYQNDVVLLAPIHMSSGLKQGGKVELGLQVKWLICSDVCIPDHAQLHLSVPVSSTPERDSGQTPLLSEAKKRLPKPWPRPWKASAVSNKESFILSIVAGKPIEGAEFYPLKPNEIENAAPQFLQTSQLGAKLTLRKSDQLLQPVRALKGLLVLRGGESYLMSAPVTQRTW